MQKLRIQDIATVQILPLFRDKTPIHIDEGNAYVISIKDVVNNWPIDFKKLVRVNSEPHLLDMRVRAGDILIPARGDYYPARYVSNDDKTIFTAGQINVIRTNNLVISGYLAWYLNQPEGQMGLRMLMSGTSMPAINKSRLLNLEIDIVDLSLQERISHLQRLSAERIMLRKEMISIEEAEINSFCRKLFNEKD